MHIYVQGKLQALKMLVKVQVPQEKGTFTVISKDVISYFHPWKMETLE